MPLGIDLALVQSLKDIDPEHLSVSHWSAVSGLGTLKIQYDWSGDPSPSNCRPEWGVYKSKCIIGLWLTVANMIANISVHESVHLHYLCAYCIYIKLIPLQARISLYLLLYKCSCLSWLCSHFLSQPMLIDIPWAHGHIYRDEIMSLDVRTLFLLIHSHRDTRFWQMYQKKLTFAKHFSVWG